MQIGQCVDRVGDARGVKWRIRLSAGLGYDVIHAQTGYRTTPSLSRHIPKKPLLACLTIGRVRTGLPLGPSTEMIAAESPGNIYWKSRGI
jgi:hypothetical protein